jgi:hypothetical protein
MPGTHWTGGSVGPKTGLDDVEKILDPTGTRNSDPSVVQPVASRYTDDSRTDINYTGQEIHFYA